MPSTYLKVMALLVTVVLSPPNKFTYKDEDVGALSGQLGTVSTGGSVCGDLACNGSETCSSCPGDCGTCPPVCGDGTCNGTETCSTCSVDCGACPPVCGDGTCNGTETCSTCPGDCGVCPPSCGDGTCNGTETCSTCPGDCGVCPPVCGDGTCNGTETCLTCSDCGACSCGAPPATTVLAGWFSARNIDGSNNTTLANNDSIASWLNQGTVAENVTQATATAKPTYITNCIGIKPCVRFDGGDRLDGTSLSAYNFLHNAVTQNHTVVFIGKQAGANPNTQGVLLSTQPTVSTAQRGVSFLFEDRASVPRNDSMRIVSSNGSSAIINTNGVDNILPAGQFNPFMMEYLENAAGNDYNWFRNNTSVFNTARTGGGSTGNATSALAIGQTSTAAQGLTGDLVEIMIYTRDLTGTEKTNLQTWFQCNYGTFPR